MSTHTLFHLLIIKQMSDNWYIYSNGLPPRRWILRKMGKPFKNPLWLEKIEIYTCILWFNRFYKGYNFHKLQQITWYLCKYYDICYEVWRKRINFTTNKWIIWIIVDLYKIDFHYSWWYHPLLKSLWFLTFSSSLIALFLCIALMKQGRTTDLKCLQCDV